MFLGTHAPRLDDKGRLVLPAKFREQLAAGLVLTKGQFARLCAVSSWPPVWFSLGARPERSSCGLPRSSPRTPSA